MEEKNYKYIVIREDDGLWNKKKLFCIVNKKSKEQIGWIWYYPKWRQYVFSGTENSLFNVSCLRDIINFIETEI